MRSHQSMQNLQRELKCLHTSEHQGFSRILLGLSVAEQARRAWTRLFANVNKVRSVYWIWLGLFIYVLVCLNERLKNSVNLNKQRYLQTEPPPLLVPGLDSWKWGRKIKKKRRKSIIYKLIRYKEGNTRCVQTPETLACCRTFLSPRYSHVLLGGGHGAASWGMNKDKHAIRGPDVRARCGQTSISIWKALEHASARLLRQQSHSPYAEEEWKVGREKRKQGRWADRSLLV